MTFGRKGVGAARPATRRAPVERGPMSASGTSAFAEPGSEIAAKREAFVAAERARRGDAPTGAVPARRIDEREAEVSSEPTQSGAPVERPSWNPSDEAAQRVKRRPSSGGSGKSYSPSLGHPAKRHLLGAYAIWWFASVLSLHRVYCGSLETAIYQFVFFFGSIVILMIYPPLGMVGFVAWLIWIMADLFLMPGMMRRFREAHSTLDQEVFE